jgi:hypothetical protein
MTLSTKQILGTAAAIGVSLCLLSPASAQRYEVSLGGGSSYLPSKSIDALSGSTTYARVDLEAGIMIPYVPILGDTEVGLAWDSGGFSGSSFGRIHSEMSLDTLMVQGRVARSIRPRFSGFGEFGMGVQWGHLYLDDATSGLARRLEDFDKAFASTLGAGLEFQFTGPRSSLDVSLRAKLNYRAIAPMHFEATPKSEGSDELLLATSTAQLGSVNTSGMAFSLGLVGRF